VQKEFERLKSDETIYKLVGPVLQKQDKVEAESTVSGRLEFINKEMWVPIPRLERGSTDSN
jgi:prefoldin beta subunit